MTIRIPAFTIAVLAVLLFSSNRIPAQTDTPSEQFQTLAKKFQNASSPGRALSDEERRKFIGEVFRQRSKLALKLIELAEKYPNDPAAEDALMLAVWNVNGTPWPAELVGDDKAPAKALTILERDHIQSEKLGQVCQRISYGFRQEYESFLRSLLEKSPHKSAQAQACLGLAHYLYNRLQRVEMARSDSAKAKEFADLFGKKYLDDLLKQNATTVTSEAEDLFELAAKKYGDEKLPDGSSIAQKAEVELFEIRFLSVGKEAPDIVGEGQDGNQFKLSDYRGKVVLLDFWSEY